MNQGHHPLEQALLFYRELGVDLLWLPREETVKGGEQEIVLPGDEGPVAPVPGEEGAPPRRGQEGLPQLPGDSLEQVAREVAACSGCGLCRTRNQTVPGEGAPQPGILFVGEGPGEEEDLQGRPFVGAAGQLLDRILERMELGRDRVFIANVVKCRPPGNRDPLPQEVSACLPYLRRQMALLKPRVIVALGRVAASWLMGSEQRITRIRGGVFSYEGIPLVPTYHPSYILRQQGREEVSRVKWEVWNDMQKALELSREPKKP